MPDPVSVPLTTRPLGVLESYRAARRNILEIIPLAALHQPMISGRTGPQRWHMLMAPAAIRRVLLEAVENYPKSEATKSILKPAIGNSLFIAEGADWRWQRRAVAPAFSARNVAALTPVMTRAAEASARRIAQLARPGRAVNLLDQMVAATFDVISEVCFGADGGLGQAEVHGALEAYIDQAARVSVLDVLGLPNWLPRPARVGAARSLARMQADADAAITRRRKQGPGTDTNLLDLLLDAVDPETGRAMTTEELRENLLTFIVAGHETTALTLSWALYLCAFDPEIQNAARGEVQEVLGARPAGAGDVAALPLTRQIIEETLRLYPAGGFLSRTARATDQLGDTEIRPGDTVMIPVYALHRHRDLWDRPDAFRPARFDGRSKIDRYQFLPFSDGPRICIGASFAMQEAVVILATLLTRFHFAAIRGRAPKPVMILTLRPEGGVWLEVTPV